MGDSLEPMKSDTQYVNAVGTRKGFPKDSFAVSVRRFVMFLLGIGLGYVFIWVPWRSSRVDFLLFYGFGAIQVSAMYTQELRESLTARDAQTLYVWLLRSPVFMNPFMSLFVSGLALVGFVVELKIGFGSKPWWQALLLPIPPFLFTGVVLFPRHNPVPPFFVGVAALLVALVLKTI